MLRPAPVNYFRGGSRLKQRPMPFLLLGAAMALGSITMLMPRRPSTHIWLGVLDWVVLCLGIASLVGMVRRKRVIPDSGDA